LTQGVSAKRVDVPEYAMALAHVASLRSEDPFRKVGAVALDFDNRVIGTAYNGLAPGFDPPAGFWDDREARQRFMLHAEINLCSLFRRGEARLVASTTMPCTSCMQTLCAYGIKEVYYRDVYHESHASEIASLYGVRLEQIERYPLDGFAGASE
jgi:dCMP deaminase